MKNMKKIATIALGALMTVSGLSLTACGAPKAGAKEITVGILNNSSERENLKVLRNAFEKKYEAEGYKVKIVNLTGSYNEAVYRMYMAGQLPDVIQVFDDTSAYWTSKGIYADLDEYIARDNIDLSLYVDSMIDIARSGQGDDDSLYWLPRDYDKLVTYVNKDVFQAAGVEVPTAEEWTWAKMLEVCQALKDNTNKVLAANQEINVFYPMSFDPSWAPVYLTMFKNYNVELASNGKAFDGKDEDIYACINEMLSLQTKGYMSYGGNVNITTGELGLAVGGVRTGVPTYEMYDVNYEVLPFPSEINGNSYVGCGAVGYGMTTACSKDKKEIAWKFLSYMFSEEGQEEFSKSGAICPVMKSLLEKEDAEWKKYSKVDDTAFYAYPERDIKVTFLQDFQPVEQHTSIYNNYTYMFKDLYKDKYNGRQTVEAFYSHYSKQIEQEMK